MRGEYAILLRLAFPLKRFPLAASVCRMMVRGLARTVFARLEEKLDHVDHLRADLDARGQAVLERISALRESL